MTAQSLGFWERNVYCLIKGILGIILPEGDPLAMSLIYSTGLTLKRLVIWNVRSTQARDFILLTQRK